MDAGTDSGNDDDDGSNSKTVLVERTFDFARFESAFATVDVAKAFSALLVPPTSNEYVYPMLRRIAITCKRPQLFFKKDAIRRLLVLFNDSLTFANQAETVEVAAWIFRQYLTVIDSPALCKHYHAEPLNNPLADKCMRAFLASSPVGTSVEPVITRHIINLLAKDGAKDAAAEGDSTDPQVAGTAAVADSVPADTLDDMDPDDFDLDKYLALGDGST
ncbi:hypothetical protein IWQ56_004752 [Coemansia nantahalensis]|nr:hypothetical protein IWQ56_004752 [Coemansia nantahalensis]